MAEEEPDYASLQSRVGPPSDEAPHPFWSERFQDEFRLQQRRPRDLDRLINRDDNDRETMLGAERALGHEPPYGSSEGHRSLQEGMIREAVEEVLAENEALRRRVTDLETFSTARTTSTRQNQSSGSRSAGLRSLEPDYGALDQLAEEDAERRHQEHRQQNLNRQGQEPESPQPRSLFSGLIQSGSAERWNALRSFLRFRPREDDAVQDGQGSSRSVQAVDPQPRPDDEGRRDRPPGEYGIQMGLNPSLTPRRDLATLGAVPIAVEESRGSLLGFENAFMRREVDRPTQGSIYCSSHESWIHFSG